MSRVSLAAGAGAVIAGAGARAIHYGHEVAGGAGGHFSAAVEGIGRIGGDCHVEGQLAQVGIAGAVVAVAFVTEEAHDKTVAGAQLVAGIGYLQRII